MDGFQLRVLTRRRTVLATQATSILVPGSEGDFQVLRNHAPTVSAMRPGRLVVDFDGARESIEVTGGFVIVRPDRVDVLLDFEDLKPG
ncbi:MAG: F0F1 ATP synthase subunit epsilon [Firmicutes bacterium]|nr:F0F1 ATP synthase subunit epsilon [Bacillota bacterium]MDH7495660.1 F0F1 ATP synthase subunit epsilon [Bacillota bacterium]